MGGEWRGDVRAEEAGGGGDDGAEQESGRFAEKLQRMYYMSVMISFVAYFRVFCKNSQTGSSIAIIGFR